MSEKADKHDRIWAPWRMEYLENLTERRKGCFLCDYRDHPEEDEKNYVIWRGRSVFSMLNGFPYAGGHCLIAPYDHVGELPQLPTDVMTEMMEMTRQLAAALRKAFYPEGFNIGMNVGTCAGAGLPDHIHQHIVPRWEGDNNFMPVLAGVRVMPEFMCKTREKILAAGAELNLPYAKAQ